LINLIGLGGNLPSASGSPRETLEAALALLAGRGLRVVAQSPWYRSPAFPPGAGPDFVNGAAALASDLAPEAVLALLHEVERALGRERHRRWAPRPCDLDLVACGDRVLPDAATQAAWMALGPEAQRRAAPDRLILPHPRLHERAFVLIPLADIAPDWRHPVLRRTAAELAGAIPAAEHESIARL